MTIMVMMIWSFKRIAVEEILVFMMAWERTTVTSVIEIEWMTMTMKMTGRGPRRWPMTMKMEMKGTATIPLAVGTEP